jgi:hypothetical protein
MEALVTQPQPPSYWRWPEHPRRNEGRLRICPLNPSMTVSGVRQAVWKSRYPDQHSWRLELPVANRILFSRRRPANSPS